MSRFIGAHTDLRLVSREDDEVHDDLEKAKFASRSEAGRYAAHIRWSRESGVEPLTPEAWRAQQSGGSTVTPPPPPPASALEGLKQAMASEKVKKLRADIEELSLSPVMNVSADGLDLVLTGTIPQVVNTGVLSGNRANGYRLNAGAIQMMDDVIDLGELVVEAINEVAGTNVAVLVDDAVRRFDATWKQMNEWESELSNSEESLRGGRLGEVRARIRALRLSGEVVPPELQTEAVQLTRQISDEFWIERTGKTRSDYYTDVVMASRGLIDQARKTQVDAVLAVLSQLVPMGSVTPALHGSQAKTMRDLIKMVVPETLITEVNEKSRAFRQPGTGDGILLTKSGGGGHWQRMSMVGKGSGPKILTSSEKNTMIHEYFHAVVEYSPFFAALDNVGLHYRRLGAQDRSMTARDRAIGLKPEKTHTGSAGGSVFKDELSEPYSGQFYGDGIYGLTKFGKGMAYNWNNSEFSTVLSEMLSPDNRRKSWTDMTSVKQFLGALVLAGSR